MPWPGPQRVGYPSGEHVLQPFERQVRDVQFRLPFLQIPADEPRDRADPEELHVVRDLAAVEVVDDVGREFQALDDLVPAASAVHTVQDVDQRSLEGRDLMGTPCLSIWTVRKSVLPAAIRVRCGLTIRQR